jgi:hypothetical protein
MITAIISLCGLSLVAAAPKTTHFFPSSVTKGSFPVLVISEGDTGTDPKIWVDDAKLLVTPGPKSGQFLVEARADCRPGWHVIRLHNKEGATNPIPLWVDDLPNVAEVEPNNAPAQSTPVSLHKKGSSAQAHGKLDKNGDVDGFLVKVPAETTLVARLEANRHLGSPMDATLQVVDKKGFVLAHNDDSRGVDPEVVWKSSEPAEVIVRVFSFPSDPNSTINFAGGPNYIYRLTLSTSENADHAASVVSSGKTSQTSTVGWNFSSDGKFRLIPQASAAGYDIATPADAEPVLIPRSQIAVRTYNQSDKSSISQFPVMLTGTIDEFDKSHSFRIEAKKGEAVTFRVFARQWESIMDPVLTIRDEKGQILLEQDDSGNNSRDLEATWSPPNNGIYSLEVRDLHDRSGLRLFYGVECTKNGVPPELQLATTNLVVKAGEKTELAFNYDKRSDLDTPLKVEFVGLPKNFPTLKAVEGEAAPAATPKKGSGRRNRGTSGAGMASVKLEFTLTPDQFKQVGEFSGPIKFTVKDSAGKEIPVAIAGEKGKRLGLDHLWLTILAAPAKAEPAKSGEKK